MSGKAQSFPFFVIPRSAACNCRVDPVIAADVLPRNLRCVPLKRCPSVEHPGDGVLLLNPQIPRVDIRHLLVTLWVTPRATDLGMTCAKNAGCASRLQVLNYRLRPCYLPTGRRPQLHAASRISKPITGRAHGAKVALSNPIAR